MASQSQDQLTRSERSFSVVSSTSSSGSWLELTTPSTASPEAASHSFLELTTAATATTPAPRKASISRANTNSEEKSRLMLLRARMN